MQVSPGVFQYHLTLNNTGTTSIGTFWFSWIPGAGFMGVSPTNVMSPAGWTDTVTNGGASIYLAQTFMYLSLRTIPVCDGINRTVASPGNQGNRGPVK